MTRVALAKLPSNVRLHLESIRRTYTSPEANVWQKDIALGRLTEYVMGLKDGGLITENERKALFCYGTIPPKEFIRFGKDDEK